MNFHASKRLQMVFYWGFPVDAKSKSPTISDAKKTSYKSRRRDICVIVYKNDTIKLTIQLL